MRSNLIESIIKNQTAFGLCISKDKVECLADYYELVQQHNPVLHLVAPCSAEEFATRHILESLTLLEYLPANARFADVGAGAGLPSVPCLIVRDDLSAVLIELKEKKAGFLQKVFARCKLQDRAEIINRQFAEIKRPDVSYVTCRALDKFPLKLPQLIKWSGNSTLLFFGGPPHGEAMKKSGHASIEKLMPMSERRFLFVSP